MATREVPDRRARKRRSLPRPGQTSLEGPLVSGLWLRDKLPAKMHTLIIGVNPGLRSATIGHYFGGKNNLFWKLLYNSGLWPTPLTTEDDDTVVGAGIGFTDTCKRPTPGTDGLNKADFVNSKSRITRIVKDRHPRLVVFVSKTAFRAFLGDLLADVNYGLQEGFTILGTDVFCLPSTSGASFRDTSYAAKLKHFKRLKVYMDKKGINYMAP